MNAKIVIQRLQELLTANGIPVPTDILQVDHPMATIELVGRPPFGQALQAQMPTFDHSAPAPHVRGSVSAYAPPPSAQSETTSSAPVSDTAPMAPQTEAAHPHGLDATQVGVNFVLALEVSTAAALDCRCTN